MSRIKLCLLVFATVSFCAPLGSVTAAAVCELAPPNLVGWWPGDGNANDIFGSNDGSAVGSITYGSGQVGYAFETNGIDSYINIPHSPNLFFGNSEAYTAAAWFRAGSETPAFIFLKNAGYGIKWLGTNQPLAFYNGSYHYSSSTTWELGRWYHIAIVDDGSTSVRLYVDGVLEKSDEGSLREPNRFAARRGDGYLFPVQIGAWYEEPYGAVQMFDGQIDEFVIFNRALGGEEIQAIYDAGSSGLCKRIQAVAVDIKPGTDLDCGGSIPVAILGDEALDVTQIDITTLSFENLNVRYKGNGELICGFEDINGDGVIDLACHYANGTTEGGLVGALFDGTRIEGSDLFCVKN